MRIEDLRTFIAVSDFNSYSKAAESLYMSRTTIMRIISTVESELKCQLFEKTSKGIRLTDKGEKIRRYAQNLIRNYDEMLSEVGGDNKPHVINLGMSGYNADKFVATRCVERFNSLNPNCKVNIYQLPRDEAREALTDGRIDFLFSTLSPINQYFDCVSLISLEFVLLMNTNSSAIPEDRKMDANNLRHQDLIVTGFSDIPIQVIENVVKFSIRPYIKYRTSDMTLIYDMVAKGYGSAVVIEKDARIGASINTDLVPVSLDPSVFCNLGLTFKTELRHDPIANRFVEFMRAEYEDTYSKM